MSYDQKKIVEAIRAFERGEIVVVMDDDGRENEGDLIVAAVHCTPEKMAFIVRHTSGIVCTPMLREDARRLNLAPMVAENDSAHTTAFTVSVDFKHGTTTGISADDRTLTVRNLANGNVGPSDFVRPGHIFPLIAREGGVLMRSGHTEAAVDLCKLANLPPVGVISELVNDDGTVMRGPQVQAFAEKNGLKQVSVADLIAYRQRQETLVERVASTDIETPGGKARLYAYTLPWDPMQHLAVVFGDIRDGEEVPVRLHPENVVSDVFGTGGRLDGIMETMGAQQRGVIVYLREGSVGVGQKESRSRGGDEDHEEARNRENEWREIGLGAQILKDLGISSINLIASRERHYVGLEGFGIRIVSTEIR
ncbi:3,4-dihydroxy-2-butanone-4-phosphate synthase [Aquamicrobium sp. NLF2-7]|jgi:3,4-dihydroxy 2-butanone 4-phosphate synthase/GTP cyclohydrolase II|uniref:3,4-dihydroxy-2-butanone 4-phosphate synthase n=1 Tax=Aquamicrobium lusatiense TaxID=89772 RepID=A0A7W9S1J3_9HYPH|nr:MULTISPECIES: 3,4-dihydroxy-2-butanone-4-phosphate synthase [Aquamicrobium]MBB6012190.1 3,4-dihydroxy 2-butanone 4-phosphate synthase/GTP cyclohydrolase II [Aquamicrobium lusatiense]MCG8273014.1 3,4-dihydroxy-2-butanone-4-phosphate synthase [Aquamicrobium sp. NLF2-7]